MKGPRRLLEELIVTTPSAAWLVLFFLVPTLIVFGMSFRPADPYGGLGEGWTWSTWRGLQNPSYPLIAWRTLWMSVLTTGICLLVGVPVGYAMARAPRRWRSLLLLLVVIPFWTNFLIRVFAWKVLLHPEGLVKRALAALHLVAGDTSLLYRPEAVLLVLVYTSIPFAILPIYAAAEKFDFSLLEAARDLGCGKTLAFAKVFLPGISRGLWTATAMVFIPALGAYVIPDLMGGPSGEMLGSKIAQRVFVDRNLPHASALSTLLAIAVLAPMALALYLQRRGRGSGTDRLKEEASA
jgi:spermidine/putrescine transport system permease protein